VNRLAVFCLGLCWCVASSAEGQTTVTVAPPSAFADQLLDRLRAGLPEGDSTHVSVAAEVDTTSCVAIPGAAASTRIVTVSVTADGRVWVCARSAEKARERSVGTLDALDAAVVEQVATMVEATLDAMSSGDDAPMEIARAADSVPQENTAVAAATTVESAPSVTSPTVTIDVPTTDAPTLRREPSAPHARTGGHASEALEGYSLTFALEPIWWVDRALTAGARVGGQRVIAPPWFWFAIDLAYQLPFGEQAHGLGADFSTFSVDTRLGYSVPLNATWTFDLAAGPRVEWLFVRPFAVSGSGASAGKGSTIFAAAASVDAGPRVQITSQWFVALRVGAVFVNQPRAFGFESPDGFVTILDQAMPRVFARIETRVAL